MNDQNENDMLSQLLREVEEPAAKQHSHNLRRECCRQKAPEHILWFCTQLENDICNWNCTKHTGSYEQLVEFDVAGCRSTHHQRVGNGLDDRHTKQQAHKGCSV